MQLVEKHIIKKSDPRWHDIDQAAWMSKNIYNAANYIVRQAFITEGRYLNYHALEKQFKKHHLLPDQDLPLKVVQQILRQLDHDWQAFFAALKAWKISPEKFEGRPRIPQYKHKEKGRNLLVYTEQAISQREFRKGILQFSQLGIRVETKQKTMDQVRIVPRKSHYVIEVIYTRDIKPLPLDPDRIASIDIGLNNLATVTFNQPGMSPLLVNGRPLKSINQWYNKRKAYLQSLLSDTQRTSRQIGQIAEKRNRQIDHYLHTVSRRLVDALCYYGFGTLVIGKNAGWKQNINLGKQTNQNFTQIPFARLIQMIQYKAALVGINVILTEESYTSKCSFLDLESIGKHETYKGKRIRRGLFVASDGRRINADVNGSYNIMRKVIPNVLADGIEAFVVTPVRVTPA